MESGARAKRSRSKGRKSLIEDFKALRDTSPSFAQTGRKRRKEGGITLSPSLNPSSSSPQDNSPSNKKGEIMRDFLDLRDTTPSLAQTGPKRKKKKLTSHKTKSSPFHSVTPSSSSKLSILKSAFKDSGHKFKVPTVSKSRVSFDQLVSVEEFTPEKRASLRRSSRAHPDQTPPLEQEHSPVVSLDPILAASSVSHQHDEREQVKSDGPAGNQDPALEPLSSEEEEEEEKKEEEEGVEEEEKEPQLATPHWHADVDSHETSQSEEVAVSSDPDSRRSVGRKESGHMKCRTKTITKREPVKTLSRALIKNLFCLSCKRRITRDAMNSVLKFSEDYLKQASRDLAVYSAHAGRKTITLDDVVLLLQRQRLISSSQDFEYLVNTHLPMEYAEELLPCPLITSAKK